MSSFFMFIQRKHQKSRVRAVAIAPSFSKMGGEPTKYTCHDVPIKINYAIRKKKKKATIKWKLPDIQWEEAEK